MSTTRTTSEEDDNPYQNQITLTTCLSTEGRNIAFSTAGDPNGAPVLFFYPGGGSRRMLLTFSDIAASASLRLICINRPGKGSTTSAKEHTPAAHVGTACRDAAHVLDELKISRAGLFFMCAGAPFAMAFACRFPERTTGKLIGIACWVLPADCNKTKTLFRFGALHCPLCLLGPLVGNVMRSVDSSLPSLPASMVKSSFKGKLTKKECDAFDTRFSETDFIDTMKWIFNEKGDISLDIRVLLSKGIDLGIHYSRIGGNVILFHAEADKIMPFAAAAWLAREVPTADLRPVPEGSHEGTLFLMHTEIIQTLTSFRD